MNTPIIKVKRINKYFKKHHVLKNITFNIQRGEIFGIIGSSGSGKTTLLNTIVGFIKPESGKVEFRHIIQGKEYYLDVQKETNTLKTICGFASQEPSFYPELTIKENLEYFGKLFPIKKEALKKNINTLLKLLNLEKARNLLAKNISGGMERRLDIACALVHNPEILILDEPTSDLDPMLRTHIWDIIKKINSLGTTIILASHHLTELEEFANRICIIKKGKIIDIDTPLNLKAKYQKEQEIHIETYPGNYDKVTPLIKSKEITKIEQRGTTLVIKTKHPQRVLQSILRILSQKEETLLDVKLWKPTLDDVFLKVYTGEP